MKKAKLDILEDIPGIEIDMAADQIPPDLDTEANVESGKKWAVNKLLLIGAPIALVVLIACGILVYFLIHNISSVPQNPTIISKAGSQTARQETGRVIKESAGKKQNITAPSLNGSEKTNILYLKDFMIDLKDPNGNNRVLMCDIVFDIGGEQKQNQLENITVLRNIIYRTAQSRSAVALRSVEERKKMKKELALELEKMLGDGSVKNVYFMNYFIM